MSIYYKKNYKIEENVSTYTYFEYCRHICFYNLIFNNIY